ncbi:MAG: M28 family peptidase, partial [bacterium]|nr:M28 family peptidase [bacterium]
MKNKLLVFLSFLIFIVFVGNNVSAQTSSKPLVVSRCETAEILPITSNIDLFYHEDNFWLFEIEKTELKSLDKLGLQYQIIDAAGWSGEYYLLTPPERKALPGPLEVGIQLYSKEDRTIVKISPSEEASLLQSGFKLMKISNTPKPIPPQSPPPLKLSVEQPDPVILSIIDKVSPDSLRAFVERLQNFRTRYTYSDSIIPAGQWIYDKYLSLGYTDVKFDTFYLNNVPHRNIIATKPGLVYPDSVLMIGGHYDATSSGNPYITAPGAEDNASGTVSAIESARILADYKLEATVKFVAWDAEEIGLRGSQA